MTSEKENELFETLGCIKNGIENLDKKAEIQNGNFAALAKKVQRHEVFIGKIGAGIAIFVFFVGTAASAAGAVWIRFWSS